MESRKKFPTKSAIVVASFISLMVLRFGDNIFALPPAVMTHPQEVSDATLYFGLASIVILGIGVIVALFVILVVLLSIAVMVSFFNLLDWYWGVRDGE